MAQSSTFLFLILLTFSSAQSEETQALEAGQPVQRRLAGGEAHSYRVSFTSGEYARVIVNEQSTDVTIGVFDNEGRKIIDRDVARSGENDMKRFYEAMLAKGLRPAAALRAAQVSMWKEKALAGSIFVGCVYVAGGVDIINSQFPIPIRTGDVVQESSFSARIR
jgi:hypothetical protein